MMIVGTVAGLTIVFSSDDFHDADSCFGSLKSLFPLTTIKPRSVLCLKYVAGSRLTFLGAAHGAVGLRIRNQPHASARHTGIWRGCARKYAYSRFQAICIVCQRSVNNGCKRKVVVLDLLGRIHGGYSFLYSYHWYDNTTNLY
jgi:hypothetical protein